MIASWLLLGCLGSELSAGAELGAVSVVYTHNVDGEIEPCG
ncbi:MAG: hypothetical protein VX519_00520 [Myxococcota bacterium]|nr:hypothetical protein [Myxococcota bacterium]